MKHYILVLASLISVPLLSQTTHTIDNSPNSGAEFTSLQAAIDAASEDDTLYVHPSQNSYGDITITKTLHLRGIAHGAELGADIFASIGTFTLNSNFGAPGITVEGLKINLINISGSENYNDAIIKNCKIGFIRVNSGSAECDNWVVAGNVIQGSGVGIIRKEGHNSWILINNHIKQNATNNSWHTLDGFNSSDLLRNNIFVTDQNNDEVIFCTGCSGVLIENSLMLFNGTALSLAEGSGEISYNNCLSYSYPGGTIEALNGNNNLDNTDPMFVDASNPIFSYGKDFHIQPGSPAFTAGTDGGELGIFGNDYPFNVRGYPDDLPYPTFMEIGNSVIAPGGTLNVSFEAESN